MFALCKLAAGFQHTKSVSVPAIMDDLFRVSSVQWTKRAVMPHDRL